MLLILRGFICVVFINECGKSASIQVLICVILLGDSNVSNCIMMSCTNCCTILISCVTCNPTHFRRVIMIFPIQAVQIKSKNFTANNCLFL
jgi:hypothetical protein